MSNGLTPTPERSFGDVVRDAVRNVQEIVRSEVRLAKTEIREEAVKAKASTLVMGAGAVAAVFALAFLLLAALYGLELAMPNWAAALLVGIVLALISGGTLAAGIKRFEHVRATPERTVETMKENIAWARQQTK